MGGRDERFIQSNQEDKKECDKGNDPFFPALKTLEYLKKVMQLIQTDELSELPAGRGIVITPHDDRQPQNDFQSRLQETLILSVTGDVFKSQGKIDSASHILKELIEKLDAVLNQHYEEQLTSHSDKLRLLAKTADLISEARQCIGKKPPSPNRDKLDTYLRTIEMNLKHYEFLQKAGVYYFGKDAFYADEDETEKLTKDKLAKVVSIKAQTAHPRDGKLYTLYKKSGRIQGYVYATETESHYLAKDQLNPFFEKNRLSLVGIPKAVNTVVVKKKLWKQLMENEFSGIDTIHKIWVNSAPSNNPCAHELLMLSEGGRVKGYAHVNEVHGVVTYIPKNEFNDYLKRDNRTVMGMQKLPIKAVHMQDSVNTLKKYIEKKWLALGFIHNCANFADEIAHAGQVPYSKLNPELIGDYHHVQYPIRRLRELDKHEALHPGQQSRPSRPSEKNKLKTHVNEAKETFRKKAKESGIPENKHARYVRYRHREGLTHEKAQYKADPSFYHFMLSHKITSLLVSVTNPVVSLALFPFRQKSALNSLFGSSQNSDDAALHSDENIISKTFRP